MLEPQPYRIRCSRRRGGTGKGNILILLVLPLRPAGKKGGRAEGASPPPRAPLFCLLAVRGDEQNEKLSFSVPPRRLFSGNSVVETLEGSRDAKCWWRIRTRAVR